MQLVKKYWPYAIAAAALLWYLLGGKKKLKP